MRGEEPYFSSLILDADRHDIFSTGSVSRKSFSALQVGITVLRPLYIFFTVQVNCKIVISTDSSFIRKI